MHHVYKCCIDICVYISSKNVTDRFVDRRFLIKKILFWWGKKEGKKKERFDKERLMLYNSWISWILVNIFLRWVLNWAKERLIVRVFFLFYLPVLSDTKLWKLILFFVTCKGPICDNTWIGTNYRISKVYPSSIHKLNEKRKQAVCYSI